VPVFTAVPQAVPTLAGLGADLAVQVVDDCSVPLQSGATDVTFSNGDPKVVLTHDRDGRWFGTWPPGNASPAVTLTGTSRNDDVSLTGSVTVTNIEVVPSTAPSINEGGAVNAAGSESGKPAAPGMLISIYGSNLAAGTSAAPSLPLPTELGDVRVLVADRLVPVLYVQQDQINAMVPYGFTNDQLAVPIVVRSGTTQSLPDLLRLSSAAPGVFMVPRSTQAIVVDLGNRLVAPGNAAGVGDWVVIYCAGLGEVEPGSPAGSAAPLDPLSRARLIPEVTIGGAPVTEISYAGLTPQFTGLYQVNARVPAGVQPGDAVELVLKIGNQTSAAATIAVE
jgi:uncharacterized protein (TIGR03437 family)